MAVKLIVTDLDGTLMAPDHLTVTKRTKDALEKAHNMGVKIAIATGRTLGLIANVTNQIPFCDYVIYSNGAAVYDRNQKRDIYENKISPEITGMLLEDIDKYNVYYNAYFDGEIYVPESKMQYYVNRGLPQAFLDEFMRLSNVCSDMISQSQGKSAEVIAIYSVTDEQKKHFTELFTQNKLYVTSSIPGEIEVTAPNVNKGEAVKGFCEKLGIDKSEVMAFGDAMNDYEMLSFAGESVAMGNACDECKKVAKHIAPTNAEDGLAKTVESMILNM